MITSRVLSALKDATGAGNITPKMRLTADLGVEDSLDMYDIKVALEDEFKISISDEEVARKFRLEQDISVFEIIELVKKYVKNNKKTELNPIKGLYTINPSRSGTALCCLTGKECDKITSYMLGTKINWCSKIGCELAYNFYRLAAYKQQNHK